MSEDRLHLFRVRTPEGVVFSFRLASPVLRLCALAIDWTVIMTAWSLLAVVFSLLELLSRDLAAGAGVVGYFLLSQGYDLTCEWLWRGQTLGKRLLRLRVVDSRGLPLTFSQIVLRNLMRFIDALPLAYLVGGVAALVSRRGQRLGDLAAGTLVVYEAPEPAPDLAALRGEKYNSLRAHPPVVARLRQAVTPMEARVAWQVLARRDRLDAEARLELFAALAGHFRELTPVPEEAVDGVSDEQFVRNVVDVLFLTHR